MGRRKKGDDVSGWIVLDKPDDMTSTHAVAASSEATTTTRPTASNATVVFDGS